jgi:plasmid stabilization system protein ParE
MVEVKFSDKATADIDKIAEYIALQSPRYAQKFVQSIFKEAEILRIFQHIGRVLPEIDEI